MNHATTSGKGREFQKEIKQRELFWNPELTDEDINWRSMGAQGEDIYMKTDLRKKFFFDIYQECKHQKSIRWMHEFRETKKKAKGRPVALFAKAHYEKGSRTMIDTEFFFELLRIAYKYKLAMERIITNE